MDQLKETHVSVPLVACAFGARADGNFGFGCNQVVQDLWRRAGISARTSSGKTESGGQVCAGYQPGDLYSYYANRD